MKTAFLLFFSLVLFASVARGQGDPAPYVKGQNASGLGNSASTMFVPNHQSTKINAYQALIETGNKNLLKDPSFEASTLDPAWVCTTDGVVSQESTIRHHGLKALKIELTADTFECVQDTTINATYLAGSNLTASGRVNTNFAGAYICSRNDGTTSTTNCGVVNIDGTYKIPTAVPFIGSSTSQGISITSKGVAVTGTLYADDMDISPTVLNTHNGAVKVGSVKFSGCSSWWVSTSTSYASMGTNAGCTITTSGNVSAPTTNVAGFRLLSRGPGKYKFEASGEFAKSVSTTNSVVGFVFRDTTNSTNSQNENIIQGAVASGVSLSVPFIKGEFEYTSMADTSFEIFGKTSTTTSSTQAGITNAAPLVIDVYYYPSGSTSTYTSQCGANCVDTFSAKVSSAGEVSNENVEWINGNCVVTSTSTYTCTYNSGVATVNMNCSAIGDNYQISLGTQTSSTFQYVTTNSGTTATAAGAQIICQKQGADFVATRTIQGSFAEVNVSPGITKPKTCHYAFGGASATLASPTECTTGTCVEVYDSCGTGTPPAYNATAIYTDMTFASGTFLSSSYIKCDCTPWDSTNADGKDCSMYFATSDNTWSSNASGGLVLNMISTSETGVSETAYIQVSCTGSAP